MHSKNYNAPRIAPYMAREVRMVRLVSAHRARLLEAGLLHVDQVIPCLLQGFAEVA